MPVSIPAERMECVNGREAPVLSFLEKAILWGNPHNDILFEHEDISEKDARRSTGWLTRDGGKAFPAKSMCEQEPGEKVMWLYAPESRIQLEGAEKQT